MKKYIPQIGDVIIDNGIPMVVVDMKNYENIGSCSYDREYFLCEGAYMSQCNNFSEQGDENGDVLHCMEHDEMIVDENYYCEDYN